MVDRCKILIMNILYRIYYKLLKIVEYILLFLVASSFSVASAGFLPGVTLDPGCVPGVLGCSVDSVSLSSITAAKVFNTIENNNFAQTWNWPTATTEKPFTISANMLTTGTAVDITTTNSSLASTDGFFRVIGVGSGTSPFVRFEPNSTTGSGLTVTNAGHIGIGTKLPSTTLDVAGVSSITSTVPTLNFIDTTAAASLNMFTDDFNRADSTTTLGPNWTIRDGVFGISANRAYITAGAVNTFSQAIENTLLNTSNYFVQATLNFTTLADDFVGIGGRRVNNGASDSNFYAIFLRPGGFNEMLLYKRVAGVSTQLGSFSTGALSVGINYTIKLEMNGTTIKAYFNGTESISVTDTSLSVTGDALILNTSSGVPTVTFDNFTVDRLVGLGDDRDAIIKIDGSKVYFQDSTGVNGSLLSLDLTNTRVGIGTAFPTALLSVNGTAENTTGVWGMFSDERLKDIESTYTDGLDKILQFNPIKFKYNGKEGIRDTLNTHIGIIAQDVEKFAPYMISTTKGQEFEDLRRFSSQALPYMLVNSIKEQQILLNGKEGELLDGLINSTSSINLIKTELPKNSINIIMARLTDGTKILTNFVSARIMGIRGYFDEVFVRKAHFEEFCLKKSDGTEFCTSGDQLEKVINNTMALPTPTISPILIIQTEPVTSTAP